MPSATIHDCRLMPMHSETGNKQNKCQALPTKSEIYAWTLRKEAIAPCLAEDVLRMHESGAKDLDFHLLGRVPCRSVKLVGTIVGIKGYETRRIYTIDDGSAIIECVHKLLPPSSPSKKRPPQTNLVKIPPAIPPPVSPVGNSVIVTGITRKFRSSKQILIDQITPCASINDQARHWKLVLDLRQSYYFVNAPFTIPQPSEAIPEMVEILVPSDGSQDPGPKVIHEDSPSDAIIASCPASSPLKLVSMSTVAQSPPRLRHPSRLHTRDLTPNTFKIYVKHYMDNHQIRSDDNPCLEFNLAGIPNMPMKRNRISDVLIPKLSSNYAVVSPDRTHCAKKNGVSSTPESSIHGFTLSYLRRVPELQDMAGKVIDTEDKMRRREERKAIEAAKPKESQAGRKTQAKNGKDPRNKLSRRERVKRLFRQAILKLCDDGSIVIWDGPKRVWRPEWSDDVGRFWKMDATADTTASLWVGSTASVSRDQTIEDDELSDPPPEEESYVSLTPACLGTFVEGAIRNIMTRSLASQHNPSCGLKGPTKDEILASLRGDGRWRRVGDWAISEALEFLREEERIWDVGEGHWELTI